MTSLAELRPAPDAQPWEIDLHPHVYDEAARVQLLAMPGIRWVPDRGAANGRGFYRGPRDAIEIVAAKLEAAGVLRVSGAAPPTMLQPVDGAATWDARLFDYQREGASWVAGMLRNEGAAFLADEMGLGKTAQAIEAIDRVAEDRVPPRLVLCPAVVVDNWERELQKWAIDPGHWHVSSFDKWRTRATGGFAAVVLDEAHKVSNPKAKQTAAVQRTLAASPGCVRLALSGTPMTTEPADLHNALDLLWPKRFGTAWQFQRRYCGGKHVELTDDDGNPLQRNGEPMRPVWQCTGPSNQAELAARLARVMLRRTKAQVGTELPPRTRVISDVTVAASARKADRRAAQLLDGKGALHSLLRETEPLKLAHAEALAREVMAAGSRPLVLTARRSSAKGLAATIGCPCVTGEDAAGKREEMLAGAPVAVATMYAVETGINLVGFDVIIFVGLDWMPSRILQAEARIHRIGQDKPVTIYYCIARGTIDEVIAEKVIQRLVTFAELMGAKGGDEAGLAADLRGDTDEDSLLAAIVAAAKVRK